MLLKAKDVTKVYGKGANAFVALDKINVSIARGESIAIIGKSGSGKSTMMHVLAALDGATSGTVAFNGAKYEDLKPRALDDLRANQFGFIFQQFFLNGRETVLENVMLPLKIIGVPFGERRERALAALKEVDLTDKAKNKATDLSGGQKQRVVIARALVGEPEIIFADEPTGNLDTENGKRIVELLFTLNRTKGITLIIVTHDADLAKLCDRQLFMKDGNLTEGKKG